MAPTLFSTESQRKLQEADRRWRMRASLRAIIVVFSLVGFSVFASAIPIWDRYFYWGSGPNSGDWQDGFPLGVLLFAFLWNIIVLYLLLGLKKQVNPWTSLIMDFLIWATLIPAVTWSTGLGMFLNWTGRVEEYVDPLLWDLLIEIGRRELVGVVFACFVWIAEITLFIVTCIDTHRWRKAKKAGQPSMRALDHNEYAQHPQHAQQSGPPPKYEDAQESGIEMNPTIPTSREFV